MKRSLKGNNVNMCLISVDIEATGPTPGLYSMYELGACVVGKQDNQFMREINLLSPDSYDPKTLLAMHTSVDILLTRHWGEIPEHAMRAFATWVEVVCGNRTPVFVANNAPFDWMFVAWYFEKAGVKNPFGHSALDMKAYFMGKTQCSWKDATLANMAKHCGIPFTALPHRAVGDALIQAQIFSALLAKDTQ